MGKENEKEEMGSWWRKVDAHKLSSQAWKRGVKGSNVKIYRIWWSSKFWELQS